MKKLLSLVLVVMILLPAFACAEEFTLRNGITFGDTMEEVLAKETFAIDEIKDSSDEESSDENSEDSEPSFWITTQEDTLAGIGNSYIKYNFDANKTLREAIYYFESYSSKDTSDSDYESINKGLVRKYGSPLGYSNGACYIFTGAALENAVLETYLFELLDGYGDIRDYDEWDVDTGDYHVKIEQVQYYYGSSYSELTYSHQMSYTYFTDDDLQAERDAKRESQEAVDNDL